MAAPNSTNSSANTASHPGAVGRAAAGLAGQIPADLIGAGLVPAVAGFDLLGGVEGASGTGNVAPPLRASGLSHPAGAVASTLTFRAAVTSEDGGLSLDDGAILRQSAAVDCALADTAGIDARPALKHDGAGQFDEVAGGATRMVGSMLALQAAAPTAAAGAPALTDRVQSHHEDGGLSLVDAEILWRSVTLDNALTEPGCKRPALR